MTSDILMVALNARYQHSSFGLRYLYANLKELQPRARIAEFTISQSSKDIAEKILSAEPRLVGFGVYIWNTTQVLEVVSVLKKIRPDLMIVLGGPEVSYETESQEICRLADYTLKGESDFLFYEFCAAFFAGRPLPTEKWISGELPDIQKIESPYAWYTEEDIRNRVMYVEASRGCPYKCEYCLSSLDKSVRNFGIEPFLADMEMLISKGARQFKFVDRTFNLSIPTSTRILRFFLERMHLGLFIHFELVPDRLPEELRELIVQFPPGALQFEIGIQTWSAEVSRLISRRQDLSKIRENFKFLREKTGVHTHADLIVGLPGETIESFAVGFDALAALEPDEIQVGLLKRLKGTPISRHDSEWEMVYEAHPPFQILKTKTMDFQTVQTMARFSRFWDLIANSGNFVQTMKLLAGSAPSLFHAFYDLAGFLSERHPQSWGVALPALVESVWIHLTRNPGMDESLVRDALIRDYAQGAVKREVPRFLRPEGAVRAAATPADRTQLPGRQRKRVEQQQGFRKDLKDAPGII